MTQKESSEKLVKFIIYIRNRIRIYGACDKRRFTNKPATGLQSLQQKAFTRRPFSGQDKQINALELN